MSRKFGFIINPAAGSATADLPKVILKRFQHAEIHLTTGPGDAVKIAANLASRGVSAVACGGDGTFREVAEGAAGVVPVGFIPLGTVNLIAMHLSIPNDIEGALGILVTGKTLDIYPGVLDTGEARHPFFLSISQGPDADAIHGASLKVKKVLGRYAYALALLQRMLRPVKQNVDCRCDGEPLKLASLALLRLPYYGGPYRIGMEVTLASKGVELVGMRGGRPDILAFYLSTLTRGLFKGPELVRRMAHVVELSAPGEKKLQIDGDKITALKASVYTDENPIKVFSKGLS